MIKVIETNLSIDEENTIKDHQSRVIEVESWEQYVQEIKDCKVVIRNAFLGTLHGTTIPTDAKIYDLTYDENHLDCEVINRFGIASRKLAYRIK